MTALLLDTHTWVWTFWADRRLSGTVTDAIVQSDSVFVSPVSFFEISQKFRLGKWPEIAPFFDRLSAILEDQGGSIAALDQEAAKTAGMLKMSTRDPFDRLLAATALHHKMPIASVDPVFDGVVTRIW